ncbi:hypothetical protein J6590_022844 [Homalodisca vitripennis]|nr:hypothetical protein J6590_022844 [Homalodisca vitripennis]
MAAMAVGSIAGPLILTGHTACQSMACVRDLIVNRVISRFGNIPWLRDRQIYPFSKVCMARLRTLDELKQRIRDEINNTQPITLRSMGKLHNRAYYDPDDARLRILGEISESYSDVTPEPTTQSSAIYSHHFHNISWPIFRIVSV